MKLKDPKAKPPSDKRRKNRQKAKRLAHAEKATKLRQGSRAMRADANIVMVRQPGESVAIGMRVGAFGHPRTTILRLASEKLVGCVEAPNQELGEVVTQIGLLTLGALLNFNLAEGPEELARRLAKWAGIDLEALKKAADEETIDEDGDVEVRTVATAAVDPTPGAVPDGFPTDTGIPAGTDDETEEDDHSDCEQCNPPWPEGANDEIDAAVAEEMFRD